MIIVRGSEAGVALVEGRLERIVQHGGAHVEDGLHRRPVNLRRFGGSPALCVDPTLPV